MKFIKQLPFWGVIDVLFLSGVIFIDNYALNGNGLWFSLLLSLIYSITVIFDSRQYNFQLPVNHPDQNMTQIQVVFNVMRSVLTCMLCLAPALYYVSSGNLWILALTIVAFLVAITASYYSYGLFMFTRDDVKFEG